MTSPSNPGPEPADAPPPAPAPAPAPIPAWRKGVYGLVAALVIFGGAELVARVDFRIRRGSWDFQAHYDPEPAAVVELYELHPVLRIAPVPGARVDQVHKGVRRVVTIGELGFRGPDVPVPKPAGTFRIAALGGSTTFDTGVTGDEKTWPARVQAMLRAARPDRAIDVVNAGCPGHTLYESLLMLRERVAATEPDVVLVYGAINDINDMMSPGFDPQYAHRQLPDADAAEAARASGRGGVAGLLRHSIIYLKLRRKALRSRRDAAREAFQQSTDRIEDVPEAGVETYERIVRELVAAARALGARPVLVCFVRPFRADTPPAERLRDELAEWVPHLTWQGAERAIARCNDVMRRVAADEGLLLIDPNDAVGPDEALFDDWIHTNDRGSEAFARAVAEAILESGALD